LSDTPSLFFYTSLRPASGCSGMAACCFKLVQHRVRLLHWLLFRRGYASRQPPAVSSMAACCFRMVQHLFRLHYWLLLRRGYASRNGGRFGSRALLYAVRSGSLFGARRVSCYRGVWGNRFPQPPEAANQLPPALLAHASTLQTHTTPLRQDVLPRRKDVFPSRKDAFPIR
jgi:hypothetical protein